MPNGYNVATNFSVKFRYADGVEMEVLDDGRNGILFEGEAGRIFVNRGTLSGEPVEMLKDHPLEREQYKLYPHDNRSRPEREGKLDAIINHMGNFFDCLRSRQEPISDVVSQHRSVSTCHLANISMRLGRPAQVGSGSRAIRRRRRSQHLAQPPAARGLRDRLTSDPI